MIEAKATRNDIVILHRTYHEPSLTLDAVMKLIEMYVINEMLNNAGEVILHVKFANLSQRAA